MNDSDPIAFLNERLSTVERERDDLEARATRLETIQHQFVLISAADDERAIAHAALRGAWIALGFTRAIWFSVRTTGEPNADFDLDNTSEPGESLYGDAFPPASAMMRCARGESDAATGYSADADAPIYDGRGWYAIATVRASGGAVTALLYADGSRDRTIATWAVTALSELAAQAALTLENVRLRAELERLAMRDTLTGLFNRRALTERLGIEMARAKRMNESLGFAMIDVDDFKKINDTRGHSGGDAALQSFASILTETVRSTDIPARFAGDEFSLIMPDTDRNAATVVMDRFYAALRTAGLACSTGVAFFPLDANDERSLFEAADSGIYISKRAGKNTYRFAHKPV